MTTVENPQKNVSIKNIISVGKVEIPQKLAPLKFNDSESTVLILIKAPKIGKARKHTIVHVPSKISYNICAKDI